MFKKEILVVMLALFTLSSAQADSAQVEVIAHRGSSHTAPENTLASIQLAWQQKSDAVEIDVYLSRDRQIVLSHDATTKRTTGLNYLIRDTDYAILSRLDAGKWKGPQYAGEKLPLLSEALATIPRGKRMFVEIKCGPEIVPYFIDIFKKSHKSVNQVCVIAFNANVVKAVKEAYPKMQAYWLAVPTPDNLNQLIDIAKNCKADGLDLAAEPCLNAEYVAKVHGEKMGFYVWTVDDTGAGKKLAQMGVDGITTNRPDAMLEALRGK